MAVKKLIEVALPLEAINAASSREKKVHKGNPSTLHLWWARRPVTATRAVLWSSLIDDPSSHPELFPDEESQTAERDRLFGILRELVKWDNTDNEEVLELARSEIRKSFNGELPLVYDPFAGGGSIPLEAQRLGMAAYASDLNPIPVMINHAMIDYPPRFASQPPVHPNAKSIGIKSKDLYLSRGLAEDVSYYGKQLEETARELLRDNYPSIHIQGLGEATPQAYIWTRTVICPNPACGCEVPLVNTFWLSKRRGKEAYVKPSYHTGMLTFSVEHGKNGVPAETKISRGTFQCPHCGATIEEEYIKAFGNDNGYGQRLMAVVAKGASGKTYVSPTAEQEECGRIEGTDECPDELLPTNPRWFSPPAYGMKQYNDLFTGRQQRALVTFSDLVKGIVPEIERDAIAAGFDDDHITLADGGRGALAYAQAIQVYLAFAVDKMVDYNSTICVWHTTRDIVANTMRRQAIQMTWDYAETNPLGGASGSFSSMLKWIVDCFRSTLR